MPIPILDIKQDVIQDTHHIIGEDRDLQVSREDPQLSQYVWMESLDKMPINLLLKEPALQDLPNDFQVFTTWNNLNCMHETPLPVQIDVHVACIMVTDDRPLDIVFQKSLKLPVECLRMCCDNVLWNSYCVVTGGRMVEDVECRN
jgi:hypothetical protein